MFLLLAKSSFGYTTKDVIAVLAVISGFMKLMAFYLNSIDLLAA